MEKFRNGLAFIADKMNSFKALHVIQRALAMIMPITLIGSLFSLLSGFPVEAWQNFITSTGLINSFQLVYNCTYGYYSLFIAFCMAYQYCSMNKEKKNALSAGIMASCAFMISCPSDNMAGYLGTTGILGAMIVGYLVGWIFKSLIKKNITIKLPEGVPPMVSQSFVALIPAALVCILFMALNFGLAGTSMISCQDMIYQLLRVPLTVVGANFAGEFVMVVYCTLLWFFGIHGGMLMMPIISVVFMDNIMGNLNAFTAGEALPNMFVGTVLLGEGLVINLAIILFSHRKELKDIAKIGFLPNLFNISEPTNFGLPIIMNPNFFLPYVMTPIIGFAITHLAQIVGFLGYNTGVTVAWTLPPTVQAYFFYGWQGCVVNLLISFICFLIYIPFVKRNDAALDKNEAEGLIE